MQQTNLLATLASLTLLAVAPSQALAQQGHQQHEMHGSGGAVAQLQGGQDMRGEDTSRSRHPGAALVHGVLPYLADHRPDAGAGDRVRAERQME
jgi:hypothetical protein